MRSKYRDALTVAGIVVVAVGVGVGVFLYSGSTLAITFFAVGVPVVLLVGGALWQRQFKQSGTAATPKLQSMTEDLATELEALLATYYRLEGDSRWDTNTVTEDIEQLGHDLENRGFAIKQVDDGYQVTVERVEMGPGAISRFSERIDSLQSKLTEGVQSHVEQQTASMNEQLNRLAEHGLVDAAASVEDTATGRAPDEVAATLSQRKSSFHDHVWSAMGRLRSAGADVDTQTVETAIEQGNYVSAVGTVIEAGDALEASKQDEFTANRDELLRVIETVQESRALQYVTRDWLDELDSVASRLDELDSVFESDELEQLRKRTLTLCQAIVTDLQSELTDYTGRFNSPEIPGDYYHQPQVAQRDPTDELNASNVADFRERWQQLVAELVDALDEASAYDGALVAYPDVVDEVEQALEETGEAEPEEVPFQPAAPIMQLYAHRNDGVTFLEHRPALSESASVVTGEYDLSVEVDVDAPGTHQVTVETTTRGGTDEQSRPVDGMELFHFEAVPAGDVEVTASAATAEVEAATEDVLLDQSRRISLTLAETTVADSICDGHREETELLLPEVADDVEATYDDNGYLTPAMDLGVQDQYKPCLLALWADGTGLALWQEDDGDVLVYDRERLSNQLESLVDHTLDEADSVQYDELRETYLTVPAPDGLIRDVLEESEFSQAVQLSETEMVKQ